MLRPALRTHRHALTRTLGPTHTRRAPRPPPLSPSAFGASDFISCFLDFNLPGQASPCPERASLSRLELSGVPCPQLGGVGSTGPALSSAQRVRGAAATTLPPLRAISRAEAIRGCPRELSPAPRAPPGSLGWASVAWASPPSPATIVKEVYFVRVAERRARGELAVPPLPKSLVPTWLVGEMWYLWGFRAVRTGDWGGGATSWGRGRVLPIALVTGLGTGKCRLVRLPKFVLLSFLSTLAPVTRQSRAWMCAPHVLRSPILREPFWKGSLDTFWGPGC